MAASTRVLRVLESFPAPRRTTNPYIVQLAQSLEDHSPIELFYFDWRRALVGGYDVFHVHWPEQLMGGHRRLGRAVRRTLTVLLCLRLWLTRTPVVRTWHNVERPAGLAKLDYWLLECLDRLTDLRIRLNPASVMPDDAPFVTILHGDYRRWYAGCEARAATPGRLAYVGLVRRYKGVEALIEAFGELPGTYRLVVAGSPTSAALAATMRALAGPDPRIDLRLAYLDDAEFVEVLTSAQLVVLPYRFMHNSGAVLAALSLDRPVLVPDNDVNRLLAAEVGPGWVHLFDGDLTGEALRRALYADSSASERSRPDLSGRTWDGVAQAHEDAFRQATSLPPTLRRRRGRRPREW